MRFQKTAGSAVFFWWRQPRNFENVKLWVCRQKHCRGFVAIYYWWIPQTRGVSAHKHSLLPDCQCQVVLLDRRATRFDVSFQTSNLMFAHTRKKQFTWGKIVLLCEHHVTGPEYNCEFFVGVEFLIELSFHDRSLINIPSFNHAARCQRKPDTQTPKNRASRRCSWYTQEKYLVQNVP